MIIDHPFQASLSCKSLSSFSRSWCVYQILHRLTPITSQSLGTFTLTSGLHNTVFVEDESVKQVEDISADDWAQCHASPVCAQTMDSKCLGDE